MRVCVTSTSYLPAIGGAQLHTHRLLKELAGHHQIRVVAHWDENRTDWLLGTTLRAPAQARSYDYESIPVSLLGLSAAERLAIAPSVLTYYLLKKRAIDCISSVLAPKVKALARKCDLIHNARIGREGLSYASLKAARELDVPFVFVPYHHPRWVGWNYREYIDLYRLADGVIALTASEKETLVHLGVQASRVYITGIGPILTPEYDGGRFRQRFGLATDPMVLFLGQQYRYKGIEALLGASKEVWARNPETRFVFIGPPTSFSEALFKQVVDRRILNLGKVDIQTKSDALAGCDILCVPSSQESFGGVYTEAWLLRKPAIGGPAPAIREVIEDGVDGYVVQQVADEIASRINYLIAQQGVRDSMGEAGFEKVQARFTWPRLAEQTERAYQAILRGS